MEMSQLKIIPIFFLCLLYHIFIIGGIHFIFLVILSGTTHSLPVFQSVGVTTEKDLALYVLICHFVFL